MRSKEQILENINTINTTIANINSQISLLENEYQKNAESELGQKCDTFTEMINNLNNSKSPLISLLNMEWDLYYEK